MSDKITVQAIYENGVFRPLVPVALSDRQRVKLQVEVQPETQHFVKFGGVLASYWKGEAPTIEEINALLDGEKQKSLDRLLRQIDGD